MKGPFGYGRYDDDPQHIGCPRAQSDMTPCVARDGHIVLSSDADRVCVGCGADPALLLREIDHPAFSSWLVAKPADLQAVFAADAVAAKVRELTEPQTINDGHNHVTRDLKEPGVCPACDVTRARAMKGLKTPNCPLCGQPPALAVGREQFFCGNEDCKTLAWNPSMGPEQVAHASFIELPKEEP